MSTISVSVLFLSAFLITQVFRFTLALDNIELTSTEPQAVPIFG